MKKCITLEFEGLISILHTTVYASHYDSLTKKAYMEPALNNTNVHQAAISAKIVHTHADVVLNNTAQTV